MPERRDPNRIEVDLRILQQRELDRLRDFAMDFGRSVDRLSGYMEGPRAEATGARQRRMAAGLVTPGPRLGSGNESRAPLNPATGVAPHEPGRSGEPSEKASWSQQLAETTFRYTPLPHRAEDWIASSRGRSRAFVGLGALYAAPHIMGRMQGGFASVAGIGAPFGQLLGAPSAVGFGQQVGLSRQGPLGLPALSPAARAGFAAQFRTLSRSWFGFNPNYSLGQSRRLEETINQLGLTNAGGADQLRNLMQRIEQNVGVTPEMQAPFIEQGFRFGTTNISQMTQALNNLGQVAQASGRNVNTLATEIAGMAQSVSQQSGGNIGTTTVGLSALVQGTGMAPEMAGRLMGNRTLTMMSWARNPSLGLYRAAGSATGRLGSINTLVSSAVGMTIPQLANLRRQNPTQFYQAMDRLTALHMANPELFPHPDEVTGILGQRGGIARVEALEGINAAPGSRNWDRIYGNLARGGLGAGRISELQRIANPEERARRASEMVSDVSKKAREGNRRRLMIGLTPEARRLIQVLDDDAPHRNSAPSKMERAVDIAKDVAHYTGFIPGTPW